MRDYRPLFPRLPERTRLFRLLMTHQDWTRAFLSAPQVAELYRKRWTLETAFKHLEVYFHSEINTLGYPKAALCGFCLALVPYNLLAVVLAAWRRVHGEALVNEEVSLYYIANEITTTYHGMMIAIPEPEWDVFYAMSTADLATILVALARECASSSLPEKSSKA